MSLTTEQIKPGAVFQFKVAARRVTRLSGSIGTGFSVDWEYADGKKRGGRLGGTQCLQYFRRDAIEEIPDPTVYESKRRLKSGREIASFRSTVEIKLTTHCPGKWAIVDLETGDAWGCKGTGFRRLSENEIAEVHAVTSGGEK